MLKHFVLPSEERESCEVWEWAVRSADETIFEA